MQTKMRPKKAATTASAATSGGVKTIGETFKKLKSENKIAFIPFVVAGDPNLEATAKALKILGALLKPVFRLFVFVFVFVLTKPRSSRFLSFFLIFLKQQTKQTRLAQMSSN